MKIKELCTEERPREKMASKGAGALTNAELLAILIGSGTQKENVLEVANRLRPGRRADWGQSPRDRPGHVGNRWDRPREERRHHSGFRAGQEKMPGRARNRQKTCVRTRIDLENHGSDDEGAVARRTLGNLPEPVQLPGPQDDGQQRRKLCNNSGPEDSGEGGNLKACLRDSPDSQSPIRQSQIQRDVHSLNREPEKGGQSLRHSLGRPLDHLRRLLFQLRGRRDQISFLWLAFGMSSWLRYLAMVRRATL